MGRLNPTLTPENGHIHLRQAVDNICFVVWSHPPMDLRVKTVHTAIQVMKSCATMYRIQHKIPIHHLTKEQRPNPTIYCCFCLVLVPTTNCDDKWMPRREMEKQPKWIKQLFSEHSAGTLSNQQSINKSVCYSIVDNCMAMQGLLLYNHTFTFTPSC